MFFVKLLELKDGLVFIFLVMSLFFFIGKTWETFTSKALCESAGMPSHKRLITFLFSILSIIIILWSIMFHVAIADNIMLFLGSVVLGGMGLAASVDIASFIGKKTPVTDIPVEVKQ